MRWIGPFSSPNVAGLETAALVSLSIILALCANMAQTNRSLKQICAVTLGIIGIAGLILSGSRAGLLSLSIALAFIIKVHSIKMRSAVFAAFVFIICLISASNYDRILGAITKDISIQDRQILWNATLSLISDHPWRGVGLNNFIPLLDRWYLPYQYQGRFATALNEPLTLAAAWGIPALSLCLFMFSTILSIGIKKASNGCFTSRAGVCLLITHAVSGLFQGHLFIGLWYIYLGWTTGIILILLGRIDINTLSSSIRLGFLFSTTTIILIITLTSFANHTWRTQFIGKEIIAIPNSSSPSKIIIGINPSSASAASMNRWCQRQHTQNNAVIFLESIPTPDWWSELNNAERKTDAPITCVANGAQGVCLLNSWLNLNIGNIPIILYDPSDISPVLRKQYHAIPTSRVTIWLGRQALFIPRISETVLANNCTIWNANASGVSWWDLSIESQ